MYKVAVIMSTYNGEKYLREQLDSILNQKDVEVTLYVRDDGSTDGTKNILSLYHNLYGIHIKFDKNIGVGNSFMQTLYHLPDSYDYYSYSDQDDIWLENKLINAIKCLNSSGKGLYASDLICVDRNSNIIGKKNNKELDTNFWAILSGNKLNGCTQVFNRKLFLILKNSSHRPSHALLRQRFHDTWTAAVASITVGIVFDRNSYIYYRQHDNNVVGAANKTKKEIFLDQCKRFICKKQRNPRSRLAKDICSCFSHEVEQREDGYLIKAWGNLCTINSKKIL